MLFRFSPKHTKTNKFIQSTVNYIIEPLIPDFRVKPPTLFIKVSRYLLKRQMIIHAQLKDFAIANPKTKQKQL